eukprot:jgi/Mesvir1/23972/Mv10736-RA.2
MRLIEPSLARGSSSDDEDSDDSRHSAAVPRGICLHPQEPPSGAARRGPATPPALSPADSLASQLRQGAVCRLKRRAAGDEGGVLDAVGYPAFRLKTSVSFAASPPPVRAKNPQLRDLWPRCASSARPPASTVEMGGGEAPGEHDPGTRGQVRDSRRGMGSGDGAPGPNPRRGEGGRSLHETFMKTCVRAHSHHHPSDSCERRLKSCPCHGPVACSAEAGSVRPATRMALATDSGDSGDTDEEKEEEEQEWERGLHRDNGGVGKDEWRGALRGTDHPANRLDGTAWHATAGHGTQHFPSHPSYFYRDLAPCSVYARNSVTSHGAAGGSRVPGVTSGRQDEGEPDISCMAAMTVARWSKHLDLYAHLQGNLPTAQPGVGIGMPSSAACPWLLTTGACATPVTASHAYCKHSAQQDKALWKLEAMRWVGNKLSTPTSGQELTGIAAAQGSGLPLVRADGPHGAMDRTENAENIFLVQGARTEQTPKGALMASAVGGPNTATGRMGVCDSAAAGLAQASPLGGCGGMGTGLGSDAYEDSFEDIEEDLDGEEGEGVVEEGEDMVEEGVQPLHSHRMAAAFYKAKGSQGHAEGHGHGVDVEDDANHLIWGPLGRQAPAAPLPDVSVGSYGLDYRSNTVQVGESHGLRTGSIAAQSQGQLARNGAEMDGCGSEDNTVDGLIARLQSHKECLAREIAEAAPVPWRRSEMPAEVA